MASPFNFRARAVGENLLRKFSEEKASPKPNDQNFTQSDGPNFVNAIAEGSLLGQAYTAEKKKNIEEIHENVSMNDPLMAIQRIFGEINSLGDESKELKKQLPLLNQLLKTIEEHLENDPLVNNIESLDYAKKIIFSPKKGEANDDGDMLTNSKLTPSGKEVLKVYMRNQLDLQESEWESYEETINTISDKLEETQKDLEEITQERNMLRTKQIDESKAYQKTISDMEQKIASLSSSSKSGFLTSSISPLPASSDDTELKKSQSEVRRLKSELEKFKANLEESQNEQDKLIEIMEQKNETITSLEIQLNDLQQQIQEMEIEQNSVSVRTLLGTPIGYNSDVNDGVLMTPSGKEVLKVYMRNQLDLQESEWESYEETINTISDKLEETQRELKAIIIERNLLLSDKDILMQEKEDMILRVAHLENDEKKSKVQYSVLLNEKNELLEMLEHRQIAFDELTAENHRLKQICNDYQQNVVQLQHRFELLQTEQKAYILKIEDAQKQKHEQNVSELYLRNTELQKKLQEYELLLQQKDIEIQTNYEIYQKDCNDLRYQIEINVKSNNELLLEKQEVISMMVSKDSKIKQLELQLEQKELDRQDISSHLGDVSDLNRSYETLQLEYNALKDELITREEMIDHLNQQIEESVYKQRNHTGGGGEEENVTNPNLDDGDGVGVGDEDAIDSAENSRLLQRQLEEVTASYKLVLFEKNTILASLNKRDDMISRLHDMINHNVSGSTSAGGVNGSPGSSPASRRGASALTSEGDSIVDEMEQMLHSMEKKVRVQVTYLQSLQDTLSDEKRKNSYFANQKKGLLEKISELEKVLLSKSENEVRSRREIEDERENALTLQHQMEELTSELRSSKITIETLQSSASQLREQIASSAAITTASSVVITSKESSSSSRLGSPNERGRSANDMDMIDRLQQKIKSMEQEKSELLMLVSGLEANYSVKSERAQELSKEIIRLKSALTAAKNEYDSHRSVTLKNEASMQALLLEKEHSIESLKDMIGRLERTVQEVEAVSEDRYQMLCEEISSNEKMKELLSILNEKESMTEALLSEYQSQGSDQGVELHQTQKELKKEKQSNLKLQEDVKFWEDKAMEMSATEDNLRATFTSQNKHYQDEISQLREQISQVESNKSHLQSRLESLMKDFHDINQQNISNLQTLRASEEKSTVLIQTQQFSNIIQANKFKSIVNESFNSCVEDTSRLESVISKWIYEYDERLVSCMLSVQRIGYEYRKALHAIQSLTKENRAVQASEKHTHEKLSQLENTLNDIQVENKAYKTKLDKLNQERDEMLYKINTSTKAIAMYERDAEDSIQNNMNMLHQTNADTRSYLSMTDEFSKLLEKFELTEKRTLELSSVNAKQYSKLMKELVYYKEENSRVKTLLDRLRIVNMKLIGDIKTANSAGLQASGVNQRFNTLQNDYSLLNEKYSNLANALEQRDETVLEMGKAVMSKEENYLTMVDQYNKFEIEANSKYEILSQELRKKNSYFEETLSNMQRELHHSNDTNAITIQNLNQEVQAQMDQNATYELQVISLKKNLQALEGQLKDMSNKYESTESSLEQHTANWNDRKNEYEDELRKMATNLKQQEMLLIEMKAYNNTTDEAKKQLENNIVDLTSKYDELTLEYNHIVNKVNHMEELYVQTANEKNSELKTNYELILKISDNEKDISLLQADIKNKLAVIQKNEDKLLHLNSIIHSHEKTIQDFRYRNENLENEMEVNNNKYEEILSDLSEWKEKCETFEKDLIRKKEESQLYKREYELLNKEVNQKDLKITSLKHQIKDMEEVIELKTSRVSEIESALNARENDIEDINHAESRLLLDMQSVIGRFGVILTNSTLPSTAGYNMPLIDQPMLAIENDAADAMSTPTKGSSRDERSHRQYHHHASSTSTRYQASSAITSDPAYDLLATPLKSILQSSPMRYDTASGEIMSNTFLSKTTAHFDTLVNMMDTKIEKFNKLHSICMYFKKLSSDLKKSLHDCDDKILLLSANSVSLQLKIENMDDYNKSLHENIETLSKEKTNALHDVDDYMKWFRLVKRDLNDFMLSEQITKCFTLLNEQDYIYDTDSEVNLLLTGELFNSTHKDFIDYSNSSHPLADVISQSEECYRKLSNGLILTINHLGQTKHSLARLENLYTEDQQSWNEEKSKLLSKINELQNTLNVEYKNITLLNEDIQHYIHDIDDLKIYVSEITSKNLEYEDNLRLNTESYNDLKYALKEAEDLCMELRSKVVKLEDDGREKSSEIEALSDNMTLLSKKNHSLELTLEEHSSITGRIRAERDTLNDVKYNLQMELESVRGELNVVKGKNNTLLDENKVRFELERLLIALGLTLDQLQDYMSSANRSQSTPDRNKKAISNVNVEDDDDDGVVSMVAPSYTEKVDIEMKRLNEIRILFRDEKRAKKQLHEKINHLEQLIENNESEYHKKSEEYLQLIHELETREKEYVSQSLQMSNITQVSNKQKLTLTNLELEHKSMADNLEQNLKAVHKLTNEIQLKEIECAKWKSDINDKVRLINNLNETISALNVDKENLMNESMKKDDLLRTMKYTNSQNQDTIMRLERNIEKYKTDLVEYERRYDPIIGDNSTTMQLELLHAQKQMNEMELIVKQTKYEYSTLDLQYNNYLTMSTLELKEIKEKYSQFENKVNQLNTDNSQMRKENMLLNQELHKIQNKYENEYHALRKLQEEHEIMRLELEGSKQICDETTALLEDEQQKNLNSESTIAHLRLQLNESISQNKAEALNNERERRLKAEHELQKHLIVLERTQKEMTALTSRTSAIRSESRKARKDISDACVFLKEVFNTLRSAAIEAGVDVELIKQIDTNDNGLSDVNNMSSNSINLNDQSVSDANNTSAMNNYTSTADTFGINQVFSCIQLVTNISNVISNNNRSSRDVTNKLLKQEQEIQHLRHELEKNEIFYTNRSYRLTEEINILEDTIKDHKYKDISTRVQDDNNTNKYISNLEAENSLLHERIEKLNEKEHALTVEVKTLMDEKIKLEKNLRSSAQTGNVARSHSGSNLSSSGGINIKSATYQVSEGGQYNPSDDLNHLRNDLDNLSTERMVLQKTILELEGMLKQVQQQLFQKYASEDNEGNRNSTVLNMNPNNDNVVMTHGDKYLLRSQRKFNILENVLTIYRKGLYNIATSVVKKQTTNNAINSNVLSSSANDINISNWIHKDVELIRSVYEEEIRILESEGDELYQQLNQGESYRKELRSRLEETMRSMYRSAKGQVSTTLSQQLEHMSNDLQSNANLIQNLNKQIGQYKSGHRSKFQKMMDEISSLIDYKSTIELYVSEEVKEYKNKYLYEKEKAQGAERECEEMKHNLEDLEKSLSENEKVIFEKNALIEQLRKGLLRTDTELEMQRKMQRRRTRGYQMEIEEINIGRDSGMGSNHVSSNTYGKGQQQPPPQKQPQYYASMNKGEYVDPTQNSIQEILDEIGAVTPSSKRAHTIQHIGSTKDNVSASQPRNHLRSPSTTNRYDSSLKTTSPSLTKSNVRAASAVASNGRVAGAAQDIAMEGDKASVGGSSSNGGSRSVRIRTAYASIPQWRPEPVVMESPSTKTISRKAESTFRSPSPTQKRK